MNNSQQLFEGVIIMLTLIILAVVLRRTGILKKSDSSITSSLVLKVTLPALIFSSLVTQKFDSHLLLISAIVAISEILSIALAWFIARILKLGKGETGALMLVSAFGMSTMLGYPIVRQVFPGNPMAMEDAIVSSEIGVGLLLFILGPVIAMYYGDTSVKGKVIFASIKQFCTSPIFVSLILGITLSFVKITNDSQVVVTVMHILKLVGNANLLLVAITIGLLLEPTINTKAYGFLLVVILLKLIFQPLSAHFLSSVFDLNEIANQVVLIETSMPSAILVAIFAKQYNCRPELVSTTIIVTLILSLISVTSFFSYYF
jgi:malate permease and related proteins